jgi:chromosome segregation ATPase
MHLLLAWERHERAGLSNRVWQQLRVDALLFLLQAESAAKDAGTGSNRSSSNGSQPEQQHLQALQGDKEQLQQQVADLQQQLEAARSADGNGTQPTPQQQQQVEALQAEVQELQAALEDRSQELEEWQIHADVSQGLAGLLCAETHWLLTTS